MTHLPRKSALLILLVAAGPATRPVQTFNNDERGFSLKLPADWVVPDHPEAGQEFTARSPPLAATRPTAGPTAGLTTGPTTGPVAVAVANLKIGGGPDGATDRQILREGSDMLAGTVFEHGGQHVTIRPGSLGTMPGRRVRYTVERPDGRVEVLTVMAVHKRVTYALTVAAPAGRLQELMPAIEAMVASFDLRE